MRERRTISPSAAAVEFIPANYFAPLNLSDMFPRQGPLEVDIGCGDGSYLATLAEQNPGNNFLGIERLEGRVRSACNKIARQRIDNARVLLVEANYAVAYLLPRRSVSTFHILFSDPWPKRRHQRRRLLDENFFRSLERALRPDGVIRVVMDQRDYVDQVRDDASGIFLIESEANAAFPSTFQRRFEAQGSPIYRLLLRKISELR